MEILATNDSYAAAIFITIYFGVCALITLLVANDKRKGAFERGLATVTGVFSISMVLAVWYVGGEDVTYDAIVTDWNEVYEQGYEVVEAKGKIVTLRKVDSE